MAIEKSAVVRKADKTGLQQGLNKNTLWVEMLEKAFAAAGFVGSNMGELPSDTSSWAQISGGNANVALFHLTGVETKFEDIHSKEEDETKPDLNWAMRGGIRTALYHVNPDWVAIWQKTIGPAVSDALMELEKNNDEVRHTDVTKMLAHVVQNGGIRRVALTYITERNVYPGKRGSGKYTDKQRTAFLSIANSLDNGEKVVVGSKDKMKRGSNSILGRSAGEHVHAGLAGPHAYSVMDYRPGNFRDLEDEDVPLWVKIRNPWGDTGRKYLEEDKTRSIRKREPSKYDLDPYYHPKVRVGPDRTTPFEAKAAKTESAEFWIPLADLTKRFDTLSSAP